MSNHLAIATVTAALGHVVGAAADTAVPGTLLRFGRPTAPGGTTEKKVHLYLYQVTTNAALRNTDVPTRDANGNLKRRPTIALNLHYLLSFYGDEQQLEPDRMLGAVVRDLHATPILRRDAISNAIASHAPTLDGSDLAEAVEQVKFTPVPLSLEELSKVWSVMMQTPHALSVAYQGTVVLIEAEGDVAPVLPVLERGPGDRGVETRLGPFPRLEGVRVTAPALEDVRPGPPSYPSAELGLHLHFSARNLGGDEVRLRFEHHDLPPVDVTVPPTDRTPNELRLVLPDDAAAQSQWAAGLYSVTAEVTRDGDTRRSNVLPLPLAPRITAITPDPAVRNAAGAVTLDVQCRPLVGENQVVVLLLAGREVSAEPLTGASATVRFVVPDAPVGADQLVQLRVDGVGSLPFRFNETTGRIEFDDNQRITVQ